MNFHDWIKYVNSYYTLCHDDFMAMWPEPGKIGIKIMWSVNQVCFYIPKHSEYILLSVWVAQMNKWPTLNTYEDITSILLLIPCLFSPFGSILPEKFGNFFVIIF